MDARRIVGGCGEDDEERKVERGCSEWVKGVQGLIHKARLAID